SIAASRSCRCPSPGPCWVWPPVFWASSASYGDGPEPVRRPRPVLELFLQVVQGRVEDLVLRLVRSFHLGRLFRPNGEPEVAGLVDGRPLGRGKLDRQTLIGLD